MTKLASQAPERAAKSRETAPIAEARAKLKEAKEKLSPKERVFQMVQDFFRNFGKMTAKERIKAIGQIIGVAALGAWFAGKRGVETVRSMVSSEDESGEEIITATKEEADETLSSSATQRAPEMCIDPALVGEVEGDLPVCRNTRKTDEIVVDHQHNAALLELLPGKQKQLDSFLEKFEANRERYERVAKAVHIPAALIAAIHYRESSMNFNAYLHNGDPLGSPTTHVPKGVLFKTGQWEEAAIHALGGNIKDANGRASLRSKGRLREQLGIDENTTDMGKLMTFAEKYNGLGYRGQKLRSCYVYGGTNLNCQGMYVADHEFDPTKKDQRLGVAAMVMGVQARESGESLRISQSNQTLPNFGTPKSGAEVIALPKRTEKPDSKGQPIKLATTVQKSRGAGGTYEVENVEAPAGDTRRGTESLPSKTAGKLRRIADQLRSDPKMEMYTGIPMVVDGYEVMMVKEEHIHSMKKYGKEGLADYYYKPHTGVAYLIKKSESKRAA